MCEGQKSLFKRLPSAQNIDNNNCQFMLLCGLATLCVDNSVVSKKHNVNIFCLEHKWEMKIEVVPSGSVKQTSKCCFQLCEDTFILQILFNKGQTRGMNQENIPLTKIKSITVVKINCQSNCGVRWTMSFIWTLEGRVLYFYALLLFAQARRCANPKPDMATTTKKETAMHLWPWSFGHMPPMWLDVLPQSWCSFGQTAGIACRGGFHAMCRTCCCDFIFCDSCFSDHKNLCPHTFNTCSLSAAPVVSAPSVVCKMLNCCVTNIFHLASRWTRAGGQLRVSPIAVTTKLLYPYHWNRTCACCVTTSLAMGKMRSPNPNSWKDRTGQR